MPLEIYRRGEIWHCRGTVGPIGRRKLIRRSLQTKNKDIAARQVAEIEKKYWDGHFDGPAAILTFAQAARLYRAAGKSGRFLDNVENYFGQTLVKDITEGSIQSMAKELYPECSGASLNRLAIVPAQAVINHAAKSGLCPRIKVERYKVDAKVKDPATLEWVEAFRLDAGPHAGTMCLFMYLTGARIGEAVTLRWEDVDLPPERRSSRKRRSARSGFRTLPTPLVVALANLQRIPGRGCSAMRSRGDVKNLWEGAIKRAGIKRLTPHSCRHGFATGLLRRGVDVVTVAWLGGWKSAAQVLKTYGHANKNPKLTDLLLNAPSTQSTSEAVKNTIKTGTSGD